MSNVDRMRLIFNRQRELMEKYHPIEEANGLMQTTDCPVDIDSREGQARLKDFAWRITEEMGEAFTARGTDFYREELMDVLHFLTEFTILAGLDYDFLNKIEKWEDYLDTCCNLAYHYRLVKLDTLFTHTLTTLAMTCNHLKNKPWKQTLRPTDKLAFEALIRNTWIWFFAILLEEGMTSEDVLEGYLGKSEINRVRQAEGY